MCAPRILSWQADACVYVDATVVATPSTMSSVNSKLVTPAGSMPLDVAMSVRSAAHTGHSSITSLTGHSPVTSLPHKPTPASGSSAGRIRAATGRSVVQRLDMNLIPSGELEDEEERACAAIQVLCVFVCVVCVVGP